MTRVPRSPGVPLGLLAVLLPALAACSGLQGTEGKDYVGGSGQTVEFEPAERDEPITASGQTVDGDALDVVSYRGRALVVNVWWSGCGPCRQEMPMLVEANDELAGDATVIGVNVRDISAETAASFERSLGVDFPSLYSPGGTALLDFTDDNAGPRALPSTLVLDPEGRIAALISGQIPTKQTLLSVVEKVVQDG